MSYFTVTRYDGAHRQTRSMTLIFFVFYRRDRTNNVCYRLDDVLACLLLRAPVITNDLLLRCRYDVHVSELDKGFNAEILTEDRLVNAITVT